MTNCTGHTVNTVVASCLSLVSNKMRWPLYSIDTQ